MFGSLIAVIVSMFTRQAIIETLKFLAYKAMLLSAMIFVLPYVLYFVYVNIVKEVLTVVIDNLVGASGADLYLQFTGIGGTLFDWLCLGQSITIILSAVCTRLLFKAIFGSRI